MFNVSSYVQKTLSVIDKALFHTQSVSEVIQKHTGIVREKDFFEIKEGILRATLNPSEKMMLFMKKEAILSDLASFCVKDIR